MMQAFCYCSLLWPLCCTIFFCFVAIVNGILVLYVSIIYLRGDEHPWTPLAYHMLSEVSAISDGLASHFSTTGTVFVICTFFAFAFRPRLSVNYVECH